MEFRVLSYNIHRAIGVDRRFRPERIASIIRYYEPDVVLLQEVDDGVPRSTRAEPGERAGEPARLRALRAGANVSLRKGTYGNATLSRFPILRERNIDLSVGARKRRGCQHTTLAIDDGADGRASSRCSTCTSVSPRASASSRPGSCAVARVPGAGRGTAVHRRRRLQRLALAAAADLHRGVLLRLRHRGRPGSSLPMQTYPSFSPRGALDRFYYPRPRACARRAAAGSRCPRSRAITCRSWPTSVWRAVDRCSSTRRATSSFAISLARFAPGAGVAAFLLLALGAGCGSAAAGGGRRGRVSRADRDRHSRRARRGRAGRCGARTPRLDRSSRGVLGGRGVASASWSAGSLASVMTGLPPSVHGATHPAHPWLRPDVPTLSQQLSAAGFATRAFYASQWSGPEFGLGRGFEAVRPVKRRAAERWLAGLPEGPSFTWIEIPLPGSVPRDGRHRGGGRQKTRGSEVGGAAKRGRAPRASAEADRRLRRLLDALERGGRRDDTLVVVLGDHGEGALAGAGAARAHLGRASVEVPVAIRAPEALRDRFETPRGSTVGLDRLYATVLELAGMHRRPRRRRVSCGRVRGWPSPSCGSRAAAMRSPSTKTATSCAGAATSRRPNPTSSRPGAPRSEPGAAPPTATRSAVSRSSSSRPGCGAGERPRARSVARAGRSRGDRRRRSA